MTDLEGIDSQVAGLHRQRLPIEPTSVSHAELAEMVHGIVSLLWYDSDYIGDYWNADKEWRSGLLEDIALELVRFRPEYGDGSLPLAGPTSLK